MGPWNFGAQCVLLDPRGALFSGIRGPGILMDSDCRLVWEQSGPSVHGTVADDTAESLAVGHLALGMDKTEVPCMMLSRWQQTLATMQLLPSVRTVLKNGVVHCHVDALKSIHRTLDHDALHRMAWSTHLKAVPGYHSEVILQRLIRMFKKRIWLEILTWQGPTGPNK